MVPGVYDACFFLLLVFVCVIWRYCFERFVCSVQQ